MEDISKYYEILGLKIGATLPQVREAYKDLVKVWHPDRFVNDPTLQEKAHRRISEINSAFSKIQEFLSHLDAYQQATEGQQQTATGSSPRPYSTRDAPRSSSPKSSDDQSGRSRDRPAAPSGPNTQRNQRHLYEAVLGEDNRIYYLTKFEQFDRQGDGLKTSWNWPAFLVGPGWALYRKMYGWFFAFWGIATLSGMFEKSGAAGVGAIIYFVFSIPFAIYANSLYHKRVKEKIAIAQLTVRDDSILLEWLGNRGGVNKWAKWAGLTLPVVGIIAAIAIPNCIATRKRSKEDTPRQFQPAVPPANQAAPQPTSSDPKVYHDSDFLTEDGLRYNNPTGLPVRMQGGRDAQSQANRGLMYFDGNGVQQDTVEAVKLFQMATAQGNAAAQNNLGMMYIEGKGVQRNYTEAIKWLRKSAEQGLVDAQYNLGKLYYTGKIVPKNDAEAAKWIRTAAEQGDEMAKKELKSMKDPYADIPFDPIPPRNR